MQSVWMGGKDQTTPITSSFNHRAAHFNISNLQVSYLCNFNHSVTCRGFLRPQFGVVRISTLKESLNAAKRPKLY